MRGKEDHVRSSRFLWMAAILALAPALYALPVPEDVFCNAPSEAWDDWGGILVEDPGCMMVVSLDESPPSGWVGMTWESSPFRLLYTFEVDLRDLAVGPGDQFRIFHLRTPKDGGAGTPNGNREVLHLSLRATQGGVVELIVGWRSDDASGHLVVSGPPPESVIDVSWQRSTSAAAGDGAMTVRIGGDPVWRDLDLRIWQRIPGEARFGVMGGIDGGSSGVYRFKPHGFVWEPTP